MLHRQIVGLGVGRLLVVVDADVEGEGVPDRSTTTPANRSIGLNENAMTDTLLGAFRWQARRVPARVLKTEVFDFPFFLRAQRCSILP
jgi:hypothetical protein